MPRSKFPFWAEWTVAALAALATAFSVRDGESSELAAYPLFLVALLFAGLAVWHTPSVEAARTRWRQQRTTRDRQREQQRLRDRFAPELRLWDRFYIAGLAFLRLYLRLEDRGASLADHRVRLEELVVEAERTAGDPLLPIREESLAQLAKIRQALDSADDIGFPRLLREALRLRDEILSPGRLHYREIRRQSGLEEPSWSEIVPSSEDLVQATAPPPTKDEIPARPQGGIDG